MAQLGIALVIALVLGAVTLSSWRNGRRVMAVIVALGGAGFLVGLLVLALRSDRLPVVPVDGLVLELEEARPAAAGTRLSAYLGNEGERAVSEVRVRAVLEQCGEAPCMTVAETEFDVLMHVAPGQRYPFTRIVGVHMPENVPRESLRWRLAALSALGYADGR